MWTIIRKEFKVMFKEKGNFFWLIILPILFIVLFASIFGTGEQTVTMHYLDEDKSKESISFIDTIKKIKGFELKTDNNLSKNEQIKQIKEGKFSSLMVIPEGFGANLKLAGEQAEIDFYRDAADNAAVEPVKMVLQNIIGGYREGKITGTLTAMGKNITEVKGIMSPPVKLNEIRENAKKINMISQIVPGYTVMFVFFILITMTRSFIKEKESGMLARLRSTPTKPIIYLAGMWLTNIFVVLIQCTVLISFGHFVYKLSIGDLGAITLIVLSLAICGTGLGLGLSLIVKSENQGVAVTQIVTMGGAALGGLWFPYDLLPPFVQTIGRFTPQFWAQRSLQDVMIRGAHLVDVWQGIIILLGFGVVGLVVAILNFKRFILEAAS